MDKEVFEGIKKGMQEAVKYSQAKKVKGLRVTKIPEDIDVKGIRCDLGMTQAEFSTTFGFSLDSVKNWESKRRKPEKPARILLCVIQKAPEIVLNSIR